MAEKNPAEDTPKIEKEESVNFCGNCGAPLKKNAKFCAKCGTPVSTSSQTDKTDDPSKRHWKTGPVGLFLFGIIVTLAASLIGTASNLPETFESFIFISAGFIILISFIWGIARLIKRIIHNDQRNNAIFWLITIIGLFVISFFITPYFGQFGRAERIELMKNYAAEAAAVKSTGDEMVARRIKETPENSLDTLRTQARKMADEILAFDEPNGFIEYKAALGEWPDSFADTKNKEEWKKLNSEPAAYSIHSLSQADAEKFLTEALTEINDLKEFGEYLYTIDDKVALRYLAGRMLASKHWIEGLEASDEKSAFLSASSAYASIRFPKPDTSNRPKRNLCVKGGGNALICANTVAGNLGPVIRSTYGYATGAPRDQALTSWQTGWSDVAKQGVALGGAGISQSPNPQASPPTRVQSFLSDCSGKGGTLEGSSVKTRLPTTEGGWTCHYTHQGTPGCWDFITYSGRRFKGGNRGCPEQNLLPEKITAKKSTTWDGTYTVQSNGDDRCTSNIFSPELFDPVASTLEVKNNQVIGSNNQNLSIDTNGQATFSFQLNDEGATARVNETIQFSRDTADNAVFSGNWSANASASGGNQTVTVTCSGTFRGKRN